MIALCQLCWNFASSQKASASRDRVGFLVFLTEGIVQLRNTLCGWGDSYMPRSLHYPNRKTPSQVIEAYRHARYYLRRYRRQHMLQERIQWGKQLFKDILTCLLLVGVLFMAFSCFPAWAGYKKPTFTSIVIDGKNSRILSGYRSKVKVHPASLTKMMTLYMLFEALEQGRYKLRDRLVVSRRAARRPPTKLGLKPGTSIMVRDAIYGLITKSANDAATVIAEALAGTESRFAQRMTQKARKLGMKHTTFKNASGLPHPQQLTTAYDMALLSQALFTRFKDYKPFFGKQVFRYRGRSHPNHNRLLGKIRGVNGIKTGYTRSSGFNLAASAERNGRWIIAVAMGCPTGRKRNSQVAQMLEANFIKMQGGYRGVTMGPLPAYRTRGHRIVPGKLPQHRVRFAVQRRDVDSQPQIQPLHISENPKPKWVRGKPLPSPLPSFKREAKGQGTPTDLQASQRPGQMPSIGDIIKKHQEKTGKPLLKRPIVEAKSRPPLPLALQARRKSDLIDLEDMKEEVETAVAEVDENETSPEETEVADTDQESVMTDDQMALADHTRITTVAFKNEGPLNVDADDPLTKILLHKEAGVALASQNNREAAVSSLQKAVGILNMSSLVEERILVSKRKKTYTPIIGGLAPSEVSFAQAILKKKGFHPRSLNSIR